MNRIAKAIGTSGLCLTSLAAGGAPAADAVEVFVGDELRTAFFEHAPRQLATAMSKAVSSWCAAAPRDTSDHSDADGQLAWLCLGKRLVYFRSVYVNGEKGRHGLVCEANGTSTLKYFGMDLVADVIEGEYCVSADFDGYKYMLYPRSLETASAARQPVGTAAR